LKYSGEIAAFASEDVVRALGREWADDYLKKRVKKNIRVRVILPKTEYVSKIVEEDRELLRTSKLIDPQKYPFSIEINIYGHKKVALMSSREEMGIIIEGDEVYKTMKLIFELLWDNLPEVKVR